MYTGDEAYPDQVTSGPADSGRSCDPCVTCGIACANTDEGECWECSTELGEAGA